MFAVPNRSAACTQVPSVCCQVWSSWSAHPRTSARKWSVAVLPVYAWSGAQSSSVDRPVPRASTTSRSWSACSGPSIARKSGVVPVDG